MVANALEESIKEGGVGMRMGGAIDFKFSSEKASLQK